MSQQDGETSEDIDGFKYRVMMLDPLIAADILADLGYLLAPVAGSIGGVFIKEKDASLGSILDGVGDDGGDDEEAGLSPDSSIDVAIEKAILGFFERFSKQKQRELMGTMSKQTFVIQPDGNEPRLPKIFSDHFRGRIKPMYQWFAFAMKVQFRDFFTGQGDGMSRALDKVKSMGGMG